MGGKKILAIDGDIGSGDIKLEVTRDGEMEIALRLEKMISVLVEVGTRDIEEPFKFFKGDVEMLKAMVLPAVKSRVMSEIRATLDRFIEREARMVESMMERMVSDMSSQAMMEAGSIKPE